jgi:phosphoglycolate phosphatase
VCSAPLAFDGVTDAPFAAHCRRHGALASRLFDLTPGGIETSVPPRRFDAIVFDLDGTLADSAADISLALRRAFEDVDIRVARPIEALVDGSPLEELFAVAAPHADAATFDRFVARYRAHYQATGHTQTRLYPGVIETLEALRFLSPRPRLAIATSKRAEAARGLALSMGIASYFDLIDGSGGSTMRHKPAPDLLLAVARALGVDPARALMVGDTARDVLAGRAAGMRTAAVLYGLGLRDTLAAAAPDHMLEDIEDVLTLVAQTA